MPITIREARQEESSALEALLHQQFDVHLVKPSPQGLRAAIAHAFARPELGRFLVAEDAGRVIGVACLTFSLSFEHGGRAAWLEELFVEPARRESGVGGALLRAACALATREGARSVELEVEVGHERAAGLYARHGFVPRERRHFSLVLPETEEGTAARSPDPTRAPHG